MPDPILAIGCYLSQVVREAEWRGYRFDAAKIARTGRCPGMQVTSGQLEYEWGHLLAKLDARAPELYQRCKNMKPEPHPLFTVVPGGVEAWERP